MNKIVKPCCSKIHKADGFLKICLLMLLYDNTGHGYFLMENLENFGFTKEDISVSTLYRNLRKMEKEELVKSSWEKGDSGPKKRVYTITSKGKTELSGFVEFLKTRKKFIGNLITAYEKKINTINKGD